MSRYPTYSYTYSPQPAALSSVDFYNQFLHDNDSTASVNHPKTSPYPSPNPPPYVPKRMNSTTKVGQDAPPVVEDEKAAAKMQDIPINSPAIQARLPAHYRHNDFECQHGHRRDGGDGGICPYMFPSNLSFDPRQGHSEYDHSHDHEADAQKPCHRSPQVRRFLLPLLVMLSIVAGIFILNACLVSSGAIASFGHWDWKGIGEWRAGVTDVDDGLVGSDTGVVTVYPTHGIARPNEGVTFPVQSPSFSSKANGVDLPQIGSDGQIQETPLRSPLKREEGAFTKHKLYLIVIFVGLFVVIILGIMLSAWCCRSAFENPCCCPCYCCACCGGLVCLECIGCGLCCEGIQELGED